jgi:hypothetical protein
LAPPASSAVRRPLATKQRALIDAIVTAAERGIELTREQAGTLAGYGKGESARVQASQTLALPHVREALIERMRSLAAMDAPAAMATLRHIRQTGSPNQRLTAAVETLKLAGVGAVEAQQPGNIMVQVVLPGELGALLAQPWRKPGQVIDHEGDAGSERHLTEAALASPAEDAPARDPSPPARKRARQAKGGGRKPRRKRVARGRRTISPSSGPVSGGEA